jgi:hypothetical protein
MKISRLGKWAMAGLIIAAMAVPLPALAAQGEGGPRVNTPVAQARQIRPDCPNNGQQLCDGSGRTRAGSMHLNRGAGMRDGRGNRVAGQRNGACNCGAAQS